MKKHFEDPELEIERFDDVIDCLSLSDGDHDENGNAPRSDLDT